jgi:hypothetical protein
VSTHRRRKHSERVRTMMLTYTNVQAIRLFGLTDVYWSRRLNVRASTIRKARVGETFKDHPTPPDRTPRLGDGRYAGKKAKHPRDGGSHGR